MGMYTEFYFRANINDGPVADWLERQINGDEWFANGGYGDHEFFGLSRWDSVFRGGGAVYQESRIPIFRRKDIPNCVFNNSLVLSSSLKDYGSEIESFVEWIGPHLEMHDGDFLGYSLYEDSTDNSNEGWRERPVLYFHNRAAVHGA
jgi:hypothetical protein